MQENIYERVGSFQGKKLLTSEIKYIKKVSRSATELVYAVH